MSTPLLNGVITPLITPFRGGEIDYLAFDHLVKWQVEQGIAGLLLHNLTGEGPTLSASERRALISRAVQLNRGRAVIIVQTGTYSTETTIRQTEEAHELGADFALVVQPYYNRPTQKGIIHHFEQIARATRIPLILDNDPQHAGVAMKVETIETLLQITNIVGILKDTSDARTAPSPYEAIFGRPLHMTGGETNSPLMHRQRACCISPVANVIPDLIVRMQLLGQEGDATGFGVQLKRIIELAAALENGGDVAWLKYAVSCLRGIDNAVRLPLTPVDPEAARSIERSLRSLRVLRRQRFASSLVQEARVARAVLQPAISAEALISKSYSSIL